MSNTFSWNTTNGDWSVGSNWTDLTSGTAGPPTTSDDADFFANGGTVTGVGTAFDAYFAGVNPWTLAATIALSDGLFVANSAGVGDLTISSGEVSTDGTFSAIGDAAGSDGVLIIDAGGTLLSTAAPETSTPILDIGDQAATGTLPAASGLVIVNGGQLNLNGNPMMLGIDGGNGTLDVENGGSVSVATANSNDTFALNLGKRGTGTVIVSGTGSTLSAAGDVSVGRGGTGTLLVESGGVFTDANDPTSQAGILVGEGSGSSGQPTGGSGTLTVNSGGSLYTEQYIIVGGRDVTGAINIEDGTIEAGTTIIVGTGNTLYGPGDGTVNVGPGGTLDIDGNGITASGTAALNMADYAGSTAIVNVSGAGAILNAGSNSIRIASYGHGDLTVSQGGTVFSGQQFSADAATTIGSNAGAVGDLTVTDTGSTYDADGQIDIGVGGSGSVLIQNGGSLITGGNTIFPRGGLVIGWGSGASGNLTVTGAGSNLTNTGQFNVGGSGNNNSGTLQPGSAGTMVIEDGGLVTTNLPASGYSGPAADIAADPGTDGSSVTVTGTNSTWNIGGSLVVGDAASGSLGISAGGTVDAAALTIGNQTVAAGDVSVSGAAILNVSGNIAVGGQSSGGLHLNNNATLQAQNVFIGGSSATGIGVLDAESGSTLTIAGSLIVGGTGAGVLILGSNVNGSVSYEHITASGNEVDINDPFSSGTKVVDGTVSKTGTVIETDVTLENSGTYVINDDANFTLNASVITDDSSYSVHNGIFQINNASGGTTSFILNAGTIDNTQSIDFNNTSGYAQLTIGTIAGFGGVISNFNTLSEITLTGTSIASTSFNSDTDVLTLFGAGDTVLGTIAVSPDIGGAALTALQSVNADGGLGTIVPCFAAGTRITTTTGDVPVEDLREGDLLPTLIGGAAAPIVWIGRRTVDCARHPSPRKVWPVRIRAGAFGPGDSGLGLPARDLLLSPDHAVFWEDVLIPVKYLLNGDSIAQLPLEQVTYYHVELPEHDVVLAEGLPTESFLDTGGRSMFENGGAVMALHPDFAVRLWEAKACAPLVVTGVELIAAQRATARRAHAA